MDRKAKRYWRKLGQKLKTLGADLESLKKLLEQPENSQKWVNRVDLHASLIYYGCEQIRAMKTPASLGDLHRRLSAGLQGLQNGLDLLNDLNGKLDQPTPVIAKQIFQATQIFIDSGQELMLIIPEIIREGQS